MKPGPKRNQKIQKELRKFQKRYGYGKCWFCGSHNGVKKGRMGVAIHCKKCIKEGNTNKQIEDFKLLLFLLKNPTAPGKIPSCKE